MCIIPSCLRETFVLSSVSMYSHYLSHDLSACDLLTPSFRLFRKSSRPFICILGLYLAALHVFIFMLMRELARSQELHEAM